MSKPSSSAAGRPPGHQTRIISDDGTQFIVRDFKTFVREIGLTPSTPSATATSNRPGNSAESHASRAPLDQTRNSHLTHAGNSGSH